LIWLAEKSFIKEHIVKKLTKKRNRIEKIPKEARIGKIILRYKKK